MAQNPQYRARRYPRTARNLKVPRTSAQLTRRTNFGSNGYDFNHPRASQPHLKDHHAAIGPSRQAHADLRAAGSSQSRQQSPFKSIRHPISSFPERYSDDNDPDQNAAIAVNHLRIKQDINTEDVVSRILRHLIVHDWIVVEDDDLNYTLTSLLKAANKVFFGGTLNGVKWSWSDPGDVRFERELLGTTCTTFPQSMHSSSHDKTMLPDSGYSTPTSEHCMCEGPKLFPNSTEELAFQVILSRPLLLSPIYHRDLLLSTFFHELIHCYLFVKCGLEHADTFDGHTKGFQEIAASVESWIGDDRLRLGNMRARLEDFRLMD
jgi:hypothetical protein